MGLPLSLRAPDKGFVTFGRHSRRKQGLKRKIVRYGGRNFGISWKNPEPVSFINYRKRIKADEGERAPQMVATNTTPAMLNDLEIQHNSTVDYDSSRDTLWSSESKTYPANLFQSPDFRTLNPRPE
ncbi:MAG: hypothetical protein Q9161_006627 [Pseudevernia consocians]